MKRINGQGQANSVNADKDKLAVRIGAVLRETRKAFNLTQPQLAEQTKLSVALLSRIENGLVTPSLGTLQSLANHLSVDIGYFFQQRPNEGILITRKRDRKSITVSKGLYKIEPLAEGLKNRFMEPIVVTVLARLDEQLNLASHQGQEFTYVLEGKLEIMLENRKVILNPGDSAYYDGEIPHAVRTLSKKPAKSLNVHFIPGSRTE